MGTSLAVQWLPSAFQCRGTKIARALGQMSLCAPTREAPKHRNLRKACAQQQRPTAAKQEEVRKWDEQQWRGQVVDHTPFSRVQPALRRGCKLRAGLWEGQNLNQDLVRKHFVPVDQWEQVIQLVTGGKEWQVCVWPHHWEMRRVSLSLKTCGEKWFFVVSCFPEHKRLGVPLTCCLCLPGSQSLGKI